MNHDELHDTEAGQHTSADQRGAEKGSAANTGPRQELRVGAPSQVDMATRLRELQRRFEEQEHELHVHQIELEIQNEELRRANQELELSHDRYAALFEFAPAGYLIFDEYGLIEDINQTGCDQLGAARSQLTGRRLSLFVDEAQRTPLADLLRSVVQARDGRSGERSGQQVAEPVAGHRMELRMCGLDHRVWDAQLECVRQLEPGRVRVRAVLSDVTALKEAQREIQRLNQTLELRVEQRTYHSQQLSEELRTLVYSVTHDMTRPLRQIQGFVELLSKQLRTDAGLGLRADTGSEPDQKSLRYLDHLREATAQMNLQMTALIAFFQSSQPHNQPRLTDLNRVIASVLHDLKQETADREVSCTSDPLPTLWADSYDLQTIFSNLIANAIKFTRPRAQAQIHIGVERRENDYLFSVRDNGVGFETSQSERMFGLFQRLHSERSFEGQGMGLALVRRIVNNLQGRVWAESVPGQGSVFWVQLPSTAPEMNQDGSSSASLPSNPNN